MNVSTMYIADDVSAIHAGDVTYVLYLGYHVSTGSI